MLVCRVMLHNLGGGTTSCYGSYAALLGYATCKLTIRHTHHHHGPSPDQLCAYLQRTAGEIFLHTLAKIGRTA